MVCCHSLLRQAEAQPYTRVLFQAHEDCTEAPRLAILCSLPAGDSSPETHTVSLVNKEHNVSVTLSLDDVYELALRALTGSQVSDTNAHPVANSIRVTEADGLHLAGLWHLPQYCDDSRSGRVDGHSLPTWLPTSVNMCSNATFGTTILCLPEYCCAYP